MGIVKNTVVTERGLRAEFVKAFNNGEMPAAFESLLMRVPSSGRDEKYGWLGDVPQLREWLDERKISGLRDYNYTIVNKSYEATLGVDRDELEDDRIGAIQMRVRDLARRAALHPISLLFDLINNGSTGLAFDGQTFYSTTHTLDGGLTTQSNVVTGTGVTFATIQADFRSARQRMREFKDDQGQPINQGEMRLAITASPALEGILREVFVAELISSGNTNVERGQVKEENIHISARLSGNDWYLHEMGEGVKPFIFQPRREVEFNQLGKDSEEGFLRKHFKYGVDYRIGTGYGLWQKSIKIDN